MKKKRAPESATEALGLLGGDPLDDMVERLAEIKRRRKKAIKNAPSVEYVFADEFRTDPPFGQYRFPLKPILDPNYGRMEVGLEPCFGKDGNLTELFLQFHQCPQHPRYANKVFVLPTHAQLLMTYTHKLSFFAGILMVQRCGEHKGTVMLSYPPDEATTLGIDTMTSTAAMVWYER